MQLPIINQCRRKLNNGRRGEEKKKGKYKTPIPNLLASFLPRQLFFFQVLKEYYII